ncbi:hypothetical protein QBC47DRAFT_186769 [Echria macrotheca]|uniref:Uncharacterized protein n=1 Tax=Echria macrotheca TaxID=438768 RepID=A0AAJ0BDT8_9PEZI|nr:hypothetical protein QBC47DRAFT_186769 [Echria macrotheca]
MVICEQTVGREVGEGEQCAGNVSSSIPTGCHAKLHPVPSRGTTAVVQTQRRPDGSRMVPKGRRLSCVIRQLCHESAAESRRREYSTEMSWLRSLLRIAFSGGQISAVGTEPRSSEIPPAMCHAGPCRRQAVPLSGRQNARAPRLRRRSADDHEQPTHGHAQFHNHYRASTRQVGNPSTAARLQTMPSPGQIDGAQIWGQFLQGLRRLLPRSPFPSLPPPRSLVVSGQVARRRPGTETADQWAPPRCQGWKLPVLIAVKVVFRRRSRLPSKPFLGYSSITIRIARANLETTD